jgi:hypothetical protein
VEEEKSLEALMAPYLTSKPPFYIESPCVNNNAISTIALSFTTAIRNYCLVFNGFITNGTNLYANSDKSIDKLYSNNTAMARLEERGSYVI